MTIQDQIARSLCYVVPQINNTPNVQGSSATQWAMGCNPAYQESSWITTSQPPS